MARRGFEVDTQQLLLAPHHAQLDGGVEVGVTVQHYVDVLAGQQARQAVAGLVLPRHRQQRHPRAQRGDIARHVGRATGPFLGAPDVHHRHRGLG